MTGNSDFVVSAGFSAGGVQPEARTIVIKERTTLILVILGKRNNLFASRKIRVSMHRILANCEIKWGVPRKV
jgi:hypothetical protein